MAGVLFLLTSAVLGALASPLTAHSSHLDARYLDDAADEVFPMPLCHGHRIEDATIDQVQVWFGKGSLTSAQLTQCYLDRIAQTNDYLHSVLEFNPDALSIAASLDAERLAGIYRGPMHGIPILTKDNIYTQDKVSSSEGGAALDGQYYPREAFVIQKARAAGCVIVGHSNLAENADHRATVDFSEGYSTRGGQSRNPYNLTQQTAGSSTGSAIAVKVNQIMVAIGTETHGSVMHPSGHIGVVGIKPTVGLTSRSGVIPGSFYRDSVGTHGRTVQDAAYLLDAIFGIDPRDNQTLSQITPPEGYAAAVSNKDILKTAVYGLPWFPYWATTGGVRSPGQFDLFMKRIEDLKAAGATIINITTPIPHIYEIQNAYGWGDAVGTPSNLTSNRNLYADLAAGYADWLSEATFPEGDERNNMSTLADVASWNRRNNATTGALGNSTYWFNKASGQNYFDDAAATNGTLDAGYWYALEWRRSRARNAIDGGMIHTMENGTVIHLDALLVPNVGGGGGSSSCSGVPAAAGYPVLTVPLGQNGWGVPSGICIYGRQWGEQKLVRHGSALQDVWRWNVKPKYHNLNTIKVPFDQRWPGYACSPTGLERGVCIRA